MQKLNPLPTMDIKRAFLKILYEFHKKQTPDYRMILRIKIPQFLRRKPFSNDEFQQSIIAIKELERDGYIELISKDKYKLTEKGINIAKKKMDEMKLPLFDFSNLHLHPELYMKIHKNYKDGDFESVILKSFKLLEEKVRAKANLSSSDYGVQLMNKAFQKKKGILRHPDIKYEGEREGLHLIMRGVISLFRNPPSHRSVEWEDPNKIMRIIDFTNFLLDIVNECR